MSYSLFFQFYESNISIDTQISKTNRPVWNFHCIWLSNYHWYFQIMTLIVRSNSIKCVYEYEKSIKNFFTYHHIYTLNYWFIVSTIHWLWKRFIHILTKKNDFVTFYNKLHFICVLKCVERSKLRPNFMAFNSNLQRVIWNSFWWSAMVWYDNGFSEYFQWVRNLIFIFILSVPLTCFPDKCYNNIKTSTSF